MQRIWTVGIIPIFLVWKIGWGGGGGIIHKKKFFWPEVYKLKKMRKLLFYTFFVHSNRKKMGSTLFFIQTEKMDSTLFFQSENGFYTFVSFKQKNGFYTFFFFNQNTDCTLFFIQKKNKFHPLFFLWLKNGFYTTFFAIKKWFYMRFSFELWKNGVALYLTNRSHMWECRFIIRMFFSIG